MRQCVSASLNVEVLDASHSELQLKNAARVYVNVDILGRSTVQHSSTAHLPTMCVATFTQSLQQNPEFPADAPCDVFYWSVAAVPGG